MSVYRPNQRLDQNQMFAQPNTKSTMTFSELEQFINNAKWYFEQLPLDRAISIAISIKEEVAKSVKTSPATPINYRGQLAGINNEYPNQVFQPEANVGHFPQPNFNFSQGHQQASHLQASHPHMAPLQTYFNQVESPKTRDSNNKPGINIDEVNKNISHMAEVVDSTKTQTIDMLAMAIESVEAGAAKVEKSEDRNLFGVKLLDGTSLVCDLDNRSVTIAYYDKGICYVTINSNMADFKARDNVNFFLRNNDDSYHLFKDHADKLLNTVTKHHQTETTEVEEDVLVEEIESEDKE